MGEYNCLKIFKMKPNLTLPSFINSLKNLLKLRNLIFIGGLFSSVVLYFIFTDYYAPYKGVKKYFQDSNEEYTFYSGSKGGFYNKIGNEIKKLNKSTSKKGYDIAGVRIDVIENTSGGLDNAVQVLSGQKSFGLIQESTISSNDELREKINYVSPLYMERLHILCKTSLIDSIEKSGVTTGELSLKNEEFSKALFGQGAKISIGPVGSGTRVVASYLLEILDASPSKITGYSQEEGLKALKSDSINVYMVIVGAPLSQYEEILQNTDEYQLIGVSPTLTLEINKKYSTNYRVSNFKSKYKNYDDINTLGSYSYLISSKDVDEHMNLEMLRRIAYVSDDIKENLEMDSWKGLQFQLDEVAFDSGLASRESDMRAETTKNIILFILSVLGSTIGAVWVLVWVISGMKIAGYFRRITVAYKVYFPEIVNVNKNEDLVYLGDLPKIGAEQSKELMKGIVAIREIKRDVRKDYESGGVSETHFRNLLESAQIALQEFRLTLTRLITHDIKSKNSTETYVTEEILTNYYASAFINDDQYQMLIGLLRERNK